MSLNWKEINLILSELQLSGSHVQGIYQPDYRTMTLELYRPADPFMLLVSLAPGGARLHRTSSKPAKTRTVPRFAEFLRSRIRGGRIISAEQVGTDRIVRIEILRASEPTLLWIRLWGGASNVIATQSDGTILDAFFRRPQRSEISGALFDPAAAVARSHAGSGGGPGDNSTTGNTSAGKNTTREFNVRSLPGEGDFNERVADHYRTQEEQAEREKLRGRLARFYAGRTGRLESARRSSANASASTRCRIAGSCTAISL